MDFYYFSKIHSYCRSGLDLARISANEKIDAVVENEMDLTMATAHGVMITDKTGGEEYQINRNGSGMDLAHGTEIGEIVVENNGMDLTMATAQGISITDNINGNQRSRNGSGIDLEMDLTHGIAIVENIGGEEIEINGSDLAVTLEDDVNEIEISTTPTNHSRRTVKNKTVLTQQGRKRVIHEKEWLCNRRKASHAAGKEYINKNGKTVAARSMKPPCTCKMECFQKINQNQRLEIFQNYWSVEKSHDVKRQYIISCVEVRVTKYLRKDAKNNKQNTLTYSFLLNNEKVKVCKVMFLNTLSISNTVVSTALKKSATNGLVEEDRRGKRSPVNKTPQDVIDNVIRHISSFPAYDSHYCREKSNSRFLPTELNIEIMYQLYLEFCHSNEISATSIAKKWLYVDIFNHKFNLSFKPPQNDTCDACNEYLSKMKDSNIEEPEKIIIQNEHQAHISEADARYKEKSIDTMAAKNNHKTKVLMMDLQKCLPTPLLSCSSSFYKRKLWTFNFTIYDVSGVAHCMMWDETKAGRGGEEMASALLKWAEETLPNEPYVEEIIIWSDNCFGQNKNIMIISCLFWILHKWPQIKVIRQKFLLKGHTHMEADTVHAVIERRKKKLPDISISTPWDWQQFIRSCSNKFKVCNMELSDFKNFKNLYNQPSAPFIYRKINDERNLFSISKCFELEFRKESIGELKYRFSSQDIFKNILLNRRSGRFPEALMASRISTKAISIAKHRDLLDLLYFIPSEFHQFYITLKNENRVEDYPVDD